MKKRLRPGHLMVLWSCAALLVLQLTASAQVLAHRYSFYSAANGAPAAVDLVGTNTGTLNGDANITGGQLILDGNAYVQLEQGIVTNDLAVTVEAWGDYPPLGAGGQNGWANLFDFGAQDTAGQDSYSLSFCVDTDSPVNDLDAAISDFDNANVNRQNCYAPGSLIAGGIGQYIAAVFDPPGGYIAIYVNGTLVERITGVTNTITPGIRDVSNWIGKDNWPDPSMIGSLDEFRVWNGALNGLEVAASYQNTFTNLNTNAGTVLTVKLSAGSPINLGGQEPASVLATATLITNSADITPLASYSSANTNIITVDSSGTLHGVGLGSALITASFAGKTNSVTVTVIEPVSILAHRYSFSNPVSSSNTVADSVGTLYATLEGDAVESGGQVILDGTVDSYIDLSSNAFASDGGITGFTSTTIDFWATFGTMSAWSYAWSFGTESGGGGGVNYLYFAANNGGGHPELNENGGDTITTGGNFSDSTVHCTTVIDPSSGIMAIYTNGVLSGSVTSDYQPLSYIATNYIYFGRSLWTALASPFTGDPYLPTNSSFQEIRIYNGALTPVQIAMADKSGPNNTNTNPGALESIALKAPSSVQWRQAVPLTLLANYASLSNFNILGNSVTLPVGLTITSSNPNVVAVNGTSGSAVGPGTASITVTYAGMTNSVSVTVVRPPAAVLTHRYSFNDGTANDSVGAANGTLMGSASISGGQLLLPNATSVGPGLDYLQLPDGIITNATGTGTNYNDPVLEYNDPSVTVEAWATIFPGQYTWAELFDFGNTDAGGLGEYDIHVSLHAGDGDTFIGISDSDNANNDYQFEDVPGNSHLDGNTNIYIAAVFNPPAGYLAIYTNGVLMGENSSITIPMAGVWGFLNKIGADLWPDGGMQGSVDEFRIYNGVLTPDQIAADQKLGPNALPGSTTQSGPVLSASYSAGNIVMSWPVTGTTGYALYSSPTIGPGAVWTLVTLTGSNSSVVAGNNQVTIVAGAGGKSQFYVLKN